ncbi:unnamed protein product [Heterobilharzia americana]|nr:unnamed protein product [Heterobilharzia americana]
MMITSQKGSFYFFSSLTSFLLLSGIFCYLYTGYTYCFISSVHLYLSICSIAFIMLFSCMSFKFPIKCRINCRTPSLLLFLVCGLLMNSLLVVAVAVEVGVSHQQGNYTYLHLSVKSPTMIAGAFLMVTSAVLCLTLLIMSKFFNQSVHDKKENSYEGIALWFGFTIGSLIFHINNSYSSVSSSSSLLVLLMLFNVSLIIHFALINEKRFILIGLSVFFLFGYLYYLAIHILPDTIATNSNHLSKELVTKFCLILHMPILITYSLFCAFHFFTFCPTLVNSIHLTHCLWDKISMRLCIFLCSFYFLFQMTFILIFISQFVWHKWLSSLMWVLCTVLWTTVRFLCFICLSRLVKVVRISCGVWHSPIAKRNGLNHVWASEGIRYLALISKAIWILAIFTTISCLILSTSVGLTSTPELLYAFQISFLMDCYLVSIFHHLSRTIGPNAIGYALIRQVSLSKSSSSLQSVSSTNSTSQLLHHQKAYYIKLTMLIENFFSHFSIHNFGCIYSSAGRTNKSVVKLVDNEDSQSISDQTLQGINNFFKNLSLIVIIDMIHIYCITVDQIIIKAIGYLKMTVQSV